MIGKKDSLTSYVDDRGSLLPVNKIPFQTKRVLFISDVPSRGERGNHFSKKSDLFYVVVKGECIAELDDGFNKEVTTLRGGDTLLFRKNTWMRIYGFTEGTILCVLSDREYDANDYCSDYGEFLRIVREGNV